MSNCVRLSDSDYVGLKKTLLGGLIIRKKAKHFAKYLGGGNFKARLAREI